MLQRKLILQMPLLLSVCSQRSDAAALVWRHAKLQLEPAVLEGQTGKTDFCHDICTRAETCSNDYHNSFTDSQSALL